MQKVALVTKSHIHSMHTSVVYCSKSECFCLCLLVLMQLFRKNCNMLFTGRVAPVSKSMALLNLKKPH